MTQAPAGWYPQSDGTQRYWDGSGWTEHTAPGAALATPPAPPVAAEAPAPPPPPAPPVAAEAPAPPAPPTLAAPPAPPANGYAAFPSQGASGGAPATPRRRVWPWIVGIGGALVVLAVLAVVLVVVFLGKVVAGPKSAAADFNDAYFSGDCETYLAVTTANFRDSDSFPGTCEQAADGYFPTLDPDTFSITLDGVTTSGSSATVTGSVTSIDFGDNSVTYELVKVDGKWKVDSIESTGN